MSGAHAKAKSNLPPLGVGESGKPRQFRLGLGGYCPVRLLNDRQWIAGDSKLVALYDGFAYRFSDGRRLQIFRANPSKYAPALGGDNIVHFAKTGQRSPSDFTQGVVHDGRLYFVGSSSQRREFLDEPKRFANADLALGGECIVCRVDSQRRMPGAPELTLVHDGIRYQFSGAAQLRRFAASPHKYAGSVEHTALLPSVERGTRLQAGQR